MKIVAAQLIWYSPWGKFGAGTITYVVGDTRQLSNCTEVRDSCEECF
jgi:hypothetical protein